MSEDTTPQTPAENGEKKSFHEELVAKAVSASGAKNSDELVLTVAALVAENGALKKSNEQLTKIAGKSGKKKVRWYNPLSWLRRLGLLLMVSGGPLVIGLVLFFAASAIPAWFLTGKYALGVYKASRVHDEVTGGRPNLTFKEAQKQGEDAWENESRQNPNLVAPTAVQNGVSQEEYNTMVREMEERIQREHGSAAAAVALQRQAEANARNLAERLSRTQGEVTRLNELINARDVIQFDERVTLLRMAQSSLVNDMRTNNRAGAKEAVLETVRLLEWFVTVRGDHPGWAQTPTGREKDNKAYLKDLVKNLRDAGWFFDSQRFENALSGHLMFSQEQTRDLLGRVHGDSTLESRLQAKGLWPD